MNPAQLTHRPGRAWPIHLAKQVSCQTLRAAGAFRACRWLSREGFLIVGWHAVSMEDEHARFPDLFVQPETLRRRLRFLSRHYQIVSLEDALRQHAAGAIRPKQAVLTFDDGMYNFLTGAVPVLREFRAPATLYVVSGSMDDGWPSWKPLLRDVVLLSPANELPANLGVEFNGHHSLATLRSRLKVVDTLHRQSLQLEPDPPARLEYLRGVSSALGVDFDELLEKRRWGHITPTEARRLADEGFSLQLHTHTHEKFEGDAARLDRDLTQCRASIERATGKPADDFCYPCGFWTKAAWPALEKNRVRSAVTTMMGPNFATTPRWALRRVMDGESISQAQFEMHCSGLRWMLGALRNRQVWHEPSPKSQAYSESPVSM